MKAIPENRLCNKPPENKRLQNQNGDGVMKINIQEFLDHCGITDEKIFPGKRLVRKLRQPGEFKSHCVILDWHHADLLHIEIKAGLSGRTLPNADLKKYPVCFQAPTYIDIKTKANDDEEREEEEEGEGRSGRASGGGGGRKLKKSLQGEMVSAFSTVMEGKVPELGDIRKIVIMGKEIAKESYAQVMEKLAEQIKQTKIIATDLLAEAGKFITKYTPPAFMAPTGGEDKVYKYDREKNEAMFGRPLMG